MPIRRHQRKPENYGVGARDGEPQLIFPPVLKSDHTMLVGRAASLQRNAGGPSFCLRRVMRTPHNAEGTLLSLRNPPDGARAAGFRPACRTAFALAWRAPARYQRAGVEVVGIAVSMNMTRGQNCENDCYRNRAQPQRLPRADNG
jgi:hypothetical protein